MLNVLDDPQNLTQDVLAHRQTFRLFSKIVSFAILHVALVLGCLALAFVGNAPLIALIVGFGGTLAVILSFTVS